MMRSSLFFLLLFMLPTLPLGATETTAPIRLSGPAVAESLPLLSMAEHGLPGRPELRVEFIPWHSPDQLRALVAGEQVDAIITTTATAAMLYNKGVGVRVALFLESPIWIVSARPGEDALQSLEGGAVLLPFGPGEMPELLFKALTTGTGVQVETRHAGNALEAVNLLLLGRGDHALLSEPAASLAVSRFRSMKDKGARQPVKRIDIRNAWRRAFPDHPHLLHCALAVVGTRAGDNATMQALRDAYVEASRQIMEQPREALNLARRLFSALAAQAEGDVLPGVDIRAVQGDKACEDAAFFLRKLHELSPASIGGAVPEGHFFELEQ
jgi:NitT/TauT family transport system substrate-binding protein